jgi:hypothetical protein
MPLKLPPTQPLPPPTKTGLCGHRWRAVRLSSQSRTASVSPFTVTGGQNRHSGCHTTNMGMSRNLTAAVHQEEDWYVAQCLEVDAASQGRTIAARACRNRRSPDP